MRLTQPCAKLLSHHCGCARQKVLDAVAEAQVANEYIEERAQELQDEGILHASKAIELNLNPAEKFLKHSMVGSDLEAKPNNTIDDWREDHKGALRMAQKTAEDAEAAVARMKQMAMVANALFGAGLTGLLAALGLGSLKSFNLKKALKAANQLKEKAVDMLDDDKKGEMALEEETILAKTGNGVKKNIDHVRGTKV